jgi:hypothetical protein
MKLYTEADLKKVISIYSEEYKTSTDEILKELNLTPIELPSDEEISAESMDLFGKNSTSINDILQYKAFKRGANWMRDKITEVTNEQ